MQKTKASIRNLKVQMGDLARQVVERPTNTFSSDITPNPREECKAINLSSEIVLSKNNEDQTGYKGGARSAKARPRGPCTK
ncbi:hypothetical protein AHAS_Ahas05G0282100 [Arachis hypogaea]